MLGGPALRSPRLPLLIMGVVLGLLTAGLVVRVLWPSSDTPTYGRAQDVAVTTSTTGGPGSDSTSTSTTSPSAGVTSPTTGPLGDIGEVRDALAAGFQEDFAPHVDGDEADCMARTVLDVLGTDRLQEISEAIAGPGNAPEGFEGGLGPITTEESHDLDQQMRLCVSEEAAARLNL